MIAFLMFETLQAEMVSTTLDRILMVKNYQINEEQNSFVYISGLELPLEVDPLIGDKISQLMRSACSMESILDDSLERGKLRKTSHDRR